MSFLKLAPALVIAVVPGLSVLADTTTEETIDEIIVQGQYLSVDRLNSVKTPTPIIDVPQSLSILTAEQIEEQAFQNFGDILRYTPGLSISQGEGHRDAIIIRGMQTTADFFIDGIRDDVQYFRPLYNIQQIEILRGANALLFGRGGGGGGSLGARGGGATVVGQRCGNCCRSLLSVPFRFAKKGGLFTVRSQAENEDQSELARR